MNIPTHRCIGSCILRSAGTARRCAFKSRFSIVGIMVRSRIGVLRNCWRPLNVCFNSLEPGEEHGKIITAHAFAPKNGVRIMLKQPPIDVEFSETVVQRGSNK